MTNLRPSNPAAETRAYSEALPYASMLFWLGGRPRSLIVLGKIEPDHRLVWYTARKQAITTYGPFITATSGTEVELRETRFGPGWSPDPRDLIGRKLERQIVVADRTEARATLRSRFRDAGNKIVTILDRRIALRRIDEDVVANDRVRHVNSYWIEAATGLCHKSRQQALPTMPPVNTEVLKFPATT